MKIVTVTEAARNFSDLVGRVHYGGESVLLVKGGRPMVKMTPAGRARTGADLAKRWPELPHLAAAEAESFGRDIDAHGQAIRRQTPNLIADRSVFEVGK